MPVGALPLESGDPLWEDRLTGTSEQSNGGRSYSAWLMALVPVTVVGVLIAWWLGTLPDHAHPEVGREVFGNVPAPIVALGRVVRVTSDAEAGSCNAGVEFIWLSVEDRRNLERLGGYFRKKYGTSGDLGDTAAN